MRKFYLRLVVAMLSLVSSRAFGQSTAAAYGFTATTGTYTTIAGGGSTSTLSSVTGNDATQTSVGIGFNFVFCGTTYTQVSVCTNGWISFANSNSTVASNTTTMAMAPMVMPFWDDLKKGSGNCYSATTGSSPNRVFTIEWNNWGTNSLLTSGAGNFQVKLYESSNVVQFCYGASTYSGGTLPVTATIGIARVTGTTDYSVLPNSGASPTPSSSTFTTSLTSPANGQIYSWCPSVATPAVSISGTPGCTPANFTASVGGTITPSYTWLPITSLSSTNTAATTATPTVTTTYTVSSNINGCVVTNTATANPTPVAIAGATTVCIGATASVTEGTSGGTWTQSGTGVVSFANFAGGTVVTGVTAGTETLTYTSVGGCGNVIRSFTVNANPTVTTSPTSGCTPVSTTASGASTYTWLPTTSLSSTNTAATTATPTATTVYTVTGTDANGCKSTATMTATAQPVAIGFTTTSVCVGSTITYTETTPGGTWSSSATGTATVGSGTGYVTGAAAGTCNISYTNGSCYVVQAVTVNALPTVTTSPISGCTPFSTTASGASTYTWLPATGLSSTNTAATTATPAAQTTYTVTGTDANGCKSTATAIAYPTPGALGGPTTVCTGSTLSITEATSGGTWTQSGTGTLTLGATYAGGKVTTGATVGALTVTYTAAAGGCFVTEGVTVFALPTVSVSPTSGCTPFSTTASGASTYTWLPTTNLSSTNTAATTATPTAVTVYTVTGTDANGCKSTATATSNPTPAAIGGATSVCVGRTASITETTTGGTWSQSGTASVSSAAFAGGTVVTGVTPGAVTLTYTPSAGGCYVTRSFTVNALPSLSVSGGGSIYCYSGSAIGLTASGSGTSYTWAPATGLSATTGASVNSSPAVLSTTYTITSTDVNGCQSTTTAVVNTHIPPVYFDTTYGTRICIPGGTQYTALYNATPTYPYGGAYSESSGGSVCTVSTSGFVTAVAAGTATISYSDATCGTITYPITVAGTGITLTASTSSSTYCTSGSPVTLTGTVSPAGADSFLWVASTGASGGLSATLTTVNTVTATPSATTTYTVYATDNTTGCHSLPSSVSVTYNTPNAITGLTAVCPGSAITLSNTTGGGTWSGGSGHATVSTFSGTQGIVTGTSAGTAVVTFTAASGCYVTYSVTINAIPSISVTPAGTIAACNGVGVAITASGASTYTWGPATGLSATTGPTVTANPGSSTTYTVTGVNVAGCTSTATKTVGVSTVGAFGSASAAAATVCPGGTTSLSATASLTSFSSYTYSNISYNLVSTAGFTSTSTTGDDVTNSITIPFSFSFFGTIYTSCTVSSNGWVSLNSSTSNNYTNYTLPNTTASGVMGPLVALGMHDMTTSAGTQINYGTVGSAPNRKFVISYNADPDLSCGGTNSGQIIFYETSNVIDINVSSLSGTCSSTVGIQNAAGTLAYTQSTPTINGTTGPIGSLPAASRYTPVPVGTFTYSWSPSGALSSSSGNPVNATVASATTYTVTAVESGGCVATATTSVATYTLPTITVTGTGCYAATETASGAVSYTWAPSTGLSGTSGAAVTASPASTTVYTATGTDSHGCTNTGIKTVKPIITVTVTPAAGCAPQSMTASSSTGISYGWSPSTGLSATTGATVTASPSAGTTYTVTASDASGCTGTGTANVGAAPSAIGGTSTVCALLTTTLTNSISGGTWSTSNSAVATVGASSGIVTGVAAGTCNITYTAGTCTPVTRAVTVLGSPTFSIAHTNCAPSASLNVHDTSATAGTNTYTWSPSTGLSATTGSTVSASPASITTYTVSVSNGTCSVPDTVRVFPTPAAIGGTLSVCSGSTRSLTDASLSGAWSSSSTGVGTIDATTGVVTGVSAGTTTINYGYAACPTFAATATFTVNANPSTVFSGNSNCTTSGTAITLSYPSTAGVTYTWAPATYLSGTTGASVTCTPTANTTYTITGTGSGGCNTSTNLTVKVLGSFTTETATALPSSTCSGGTSLLSGTVPLSGYSVGYAPYSLATITTTLGSTSGDDANTGALTIPFTFNYYGVNYTSIYVCTNGWMSFTNSGTNYANASIPSATAYSDIGAGVAFGLHDLNTAVSGTITVGWTGTAPNRQVIIYWNGVGEFGGSGSGTGVSGQVILYETTNVIDEMITYSNLSTTSHSSTFGIQGVASTDGVTVPGMNSTSTNISTPQGWRFTPVSMTYAWSPSTNLSATTGTSATLTSAPGAGTYSITATDAGTGCFFKSNTTVTTGPLNVTVTNPFTACPGTTGTWTLGSAPSSTVYYNINHGSVASVVLDATGMGTVNVTMAGDDTLNLVSINAGSCSNSLAAGNYRIQQYCPCTPQYYEPTIFSSTAATDAMNHVQMGGYGSTSINDAFAPSYSGYFDHTSTVAMDTLQGGSTYSGTLSYNANYSYFANEIWIDYNDDGTFASSEILAPIFGTPAVSISSNSFSVTLPIAATVGSHRMRVRNTNTLTTTLEADMSPCAYSNTNTYYYGSCVDYQVYVKAPPPCSGTPTAGTTTATATSGCSGYSTSLALSGSSVASSLTYQWQYSFDGTTYFNVTGATTNAYVATITNVNIYYRCYVYCTISGLGSNSTPMLLHCTPAIGGASTVCQSGTATITDSLAGGTWSSSATGTATIDATTGVVTGVAAGSVNISYTTASCTQSVGINVVGVPGSITGTASVCNGFQTTLADGTALGTWSSANTAVASVDASTGIVTGMSNGTTTITYSTGCAPAATVSYTVNMQPSPIGGPLSICISGGAVTLTDTATGGSWSVLPTTYGTIASSTGVVTPAGTSGTETVTYTRSGCTVTATLGFGSTGPGANSGSTTVCAGSSTTLTNGTLGGSWSSSNTAVATVGSTSGIVTGVTGGTCTITYNNGCGIRTSSYTVNGSAVALTYSSGGFSGPICAGGTLTLSTGALTGGTYSWSGPITFTSTLLNPTIATVTTAASGTYSLTATYGSCIYNKTVFVSVETPPTVTASRTPTTICSGGTSTLSGTVVGPSSSNYVYDLVDYNTVYTATTGAATTVAGADDATYPVSLPFSLSFYGNSYSTVNVNTNGYVNFGLGLGAGIPASYIAATLPSASAPLGMIAVFQHDLTSASSGTVKYEIIGATPNRKVVVAYNAVPDVSCGGTNTGEIILYENQNYFDLCVSAVSGTCLGDMGVQNMTGTLASTIYNNTSYTISSNLAYRFHMPNYTYAWSPSTGLSTTTALSTVSTGLTSTQVYSLITTDTRGCTSGTTTKDTVTVVPQPTVTVSPSETTLCTGGHMILTATPSGGVGPITGYTWTGPGISSTTGASVTASFNPTAAATTTGAYSVSVAYAGSGCNNAVNSTSSVTINTQPVVTVAPSATSLCSGATLTLTESLTSGGSGTPTYSWSGPGITTTTGTSNVSPTFTPSVSSGSYSVAVSYSDSGCVTANANTGTVTDNALPTVYRVTSGNGCSAAGLNITIGGSQVGVNYQLYIGGSTTVGSAVAGTGGTLSLGTQYTAGSYTVVATGAGGCTSNMTGASVITASPTVYSVTGGNGCTSSCITVGLSNSQSGVSYQLFNGTSGGSTVSGTGSAITFGLQCAAGTYTIAATGSASCSVNMSGGDTVTASPTTYAVTGGNGCSSSGITVGVAGSQTGVTYSMYVSGSLTASLSGTGSSLSYGSRSTVGAYTVVATSAAGCQTTMTGSDTVNASPSAFSMTGGGSYCGSTSLPIGTTGSDASTATYYLYYGGSALTYTLGTGSAIGFGTFSGTGTYSGVAVGAGGCSTNSSSNVTIADNSVAVTLGASPSICTNATDVFYSYTGATGTPTPNTYSIAWGSSATTAGFTAVPGAGLPSSAVDVAIPTGISAGSYTGTFTISNGICTSPDQTMTINVVSFPTAAITSATAPCMGDATSVVISGTSGATISYNVDGGTPSTATLSGGSYSLGTGALSGAHAYELLTVYNPTCTTVKDTTVTITPTPMQWVGGTTGFATDWNTSSNWSCGYVPTSANDVEIPNTANQPVITSGTFSTRSLKLDSSATIAINSGATLNVTGNLTNYSSVTGGGSFVMAGTSAQTMAGTGYLNNLTINSSSTVSINTGSKVIVNSTLNMSAGTFATNDSLVLNSSDSAHTARVTPISGGTISGQVRMIMTIEGGYRAYRFAGHPFSNSIPLSQLQSYIDITGAGGPANGFDISASNTPSAYWYNTNYANSSLGADPGWRAFTSTSGTPDTNMFHKYEGIRLYDRGAKGEGMGYITTYYPSTHRWGMKGNLNQGTQVVHMVKGTGANQDYNMIANPMPSPVDLGTVMYNAKHDGNIAGNYFFMWNPRLGSTGQFQAQLIGTATPIPYYINQFTCFQVRAAANYDSLVFHESDKVASVSAWLLKETGEHASFTIYDGNYHAWDMLSIKFNAEAKNAEDVELDARKAKGFDFNFYSISDDNQQLMVDSRPYSAEKTIPLGIASNYEQDMIIKAEEVALPEGGSLYLHDKLLGQYVQMLQGSEYRFTITSDAATQGEQRFELSMKPSAANGMKVSMVPNPASDEVNVNFNTAKAENVSVRVLDMSGVSVFNADLGIQQTGTVKIPVSNFASGIYMVELTSGDHKVVQRLVKE